MYSATYFSWNEEMLIAALKRSVRYMQHIDMLFFKRLRKVKT